MSAEPRTVVAGRLSRSLLARWLTRSAWITGIAVIVVLFIAGIGRGGAPASAMNAVDSVGFIAFVVSFSTVGALLAEKRPRHPIGWLLLGSAVCYSVGGLGVSLPPEPGGTLSPSLLAQWAGGWAWGVAVALAVIALLLFPDGRLASRRWLPVLAITIFGIVAFVVGLGFGARTIGDAGTPNPFAVGGPIGDALRLLPDGFPLVLIAALLAVGSIGNRFRRARGVERQQIKWLLYAALLVGLAVVVVLAPLPLSTDAGNAITTSALACVPLAVGVAILRYRLYDVDRIISRTLSYAIVSGVLATVFIGVVLALQLAFAGFTSRNALAVAASTIMVATLFQPVRARVQQTVDQRFNRARYDADRTMEAFAQGVRDELDLPALRTHVVRVVEHTLQPSRVVAWLRPTDEGRS